MRLIFVRHYKTLNNANQKIMGWGDAPRVKEWESDLAFVDKRLRESGVRIDVVYSSFLERARQTAMYHARRRGMHIIHDVPALNEVNYGSLYGKRKRWVAEHFPKYKTDPDFVHPEGESFRQMQHRSVNFLLSLEKKHRDQTVLVVVHAGVIRGGICHFLGLDFADHLKQKVSHRYIGEFRVENGVCCYYDELGKPSGFVKTGAVRVPFEAPRKGAQAAAQGPVPVERLPGELSGETTHRGRSGLSRPAVLGAGRGTFLKGQD